MSDHARVQARRLKVNYPHPPMTPGQAQEYRRWLGRHTPGRATAIVTAAIEAHDFLPRISQLQAIARDLANAATRDTAPIGADDHRLDRCGYCEQPTPCHCQRSDDLAAIHASAPPEFRPGPVDREASAEYARYWRDRTRATLNRAARRHGSSALAGALADALPDDESDPF